MAWAPSRLAVAARNRETVLEALRGPQGGAPQTWRAAELADATGLSLNTVKTHLRALKAAKLAGQVKDTSGVPGNPTRWKATKVPK